MSTITEGLNIQNDNNTALVVYKKKSSNLNSEEKVNSVTRTIFLSFCGAFGFAAIPLFLITNPSSHIVISYAAIGATFVPMYRQLKIIVEIIRDKVNSYLFITKTSKNEDEKIYKLLPRDKCLYEIYKVFDEFDPKAIEKIKLLFCNIVISFMYSSLFGRRVASSTYSMPLIISATAIGSNFCQLIWELVIQINKIVMIVKNYFSQSNLPKKEMSKERAFQILEVPNEKIDDYNFIDAQYVKLIDCITPKVKLKPSPLLTAINDFLEDIREAYNIVKKK